MKSAKTSEEIPARPGLLRPCNITKLGLVCLVFVFLRFAYLCMSAVFGCMPAGQKRASDPITDGCEPLCGCWELNSALNH